MKILAPYIGVSGFENPQGIPSILETFVDRVVGSNRRLHVGVSVGPKVMKDKDLRSHKTEIIQRIFREAAHATGCRGTTYNCIHLFHDNIDDPQLWNVFYLALMMGGNYVDALQINMAWPLKEQIEKGIGILRDPPEIILQIGTQALEDIHNDPLELVKKLKEYDVIDRILLDESMGQGIELDPTKLLPYLRAVKKALPNLGLGVAGGLGPQTMHLIEPIVEEFPTISWDAEAKLRGYARNNPLDIDSAQKYVEESCKLLH